MEMTREDRLICDTRQEIHKKLMEINSDMYKFNPSLEELCRIYDLLCEVDNTFMPFN